ncbi:gluconeogenesis factor YvcK family protein [Thiovibrio sp. JS02]
MTRTAEARFGLLDLLPEGDLAEKLIALALGGAPAAPGHLGGELCRLAKTLNATETRDVRVVVFGGGTGLANLLGGDSRGARWPKDPFRGIKEIFPNTRAVVCVTDDGGSTGELLKDLPLIALGDIRHVLLSSVRKQKLQKQYGLDDREAARICIQLHRLFNYRFDARPHSVADLLAGAGTDLDLLPEFMRRALYWLLDELFRNALLAPQLARPHCLGNLLLASAIYQHGDGRHGPGEGRIGGETILRGIGFLADLIGANQDAVYPCTTTPAHLKILYTNGVLVSGEFKSGQAKRGYPMERVFVEFAREPEVPAQVLAAIAEADIILYAPGSLFTSIVPILQVPGIAEAIRANSRALKLLVANLWVQTGETDIAHDDPRRRFHVSDLISAYHRNIPGGVADLFEQILILGLRDIPGSILQNYAIEDKVPIYLDREKVREMGFAPVEARLYSQDDIDRRRVIQHDPASLAEAVRVMWAIRELLPAGGRKMLPPPLLCPGVLLNPKGQTPDARFAEINHRLAALEIAPDLRPLLSAIFWNHWDIPVCHLDFLAGVKLLDNEEWQGAQEWNTVFAFYDPGDRFIKMRREVVEEPARFEVGLLIALGQSLLGNYAAEKSRVPVLRDGEQLGYEFRLLLRPEAELRAYFTGEELDHYLPLVRMRRAAGNPRLYTRLVNGEEGFTPPGLFFGLTYAWYLDNRYACHVEFKMSIGRMTLCNLIPEQKKDAGRRREVIDFFRTIVFKDNASHFRP